MMSTKTKCGVLIMVRYTDEQTHHINTITQRESADHDRERDTTLSVCHFLKIVVKYGGEYFKACL